MRVKQSVDCTECINLTITHSSLTGEVATKVVLSFQQVEMSFYTLVTIFESLQWAVMSMTDHFIKSHIRKPFLHLLYACKDTYGQWL